MQEIVKKVFVKLHDARIIYLISDSDWDSLVHIVPMKGVTAILKNKEMSSYLLE